MSVEVLKHIWPEWQIEGRPLGRGSFGIVYKAVRRDHGVESFAAIKEISIPSDPSELDSLRSEGLDMNFTRTYLHSIVNEFIKEIQIMESLKGIQNIVSVEDYKVVEKRDEIGWDIYIRMELLTSFNNYICDKKLSEEEVIKLGCDICKALEICAKRNIIHRDIKPENIFINDFGDFKLGDFGIARKLENMTGGLSQKGTFNYMAPEVALGSEYDARVDTYSLGIVMYRLLNSNRLPFLDTEKQLLNPNERRNAVDRRLRGEALPAPCDASPAMAELILRACAYDPGMRFATAAEMKLALMSAANGTYQISANNPGRTRPVRKAADSYDKTYSVRKAPAADAQKAAPAVYTFGSAPPKKSKLPAVIAAVLAAVLLVCAGYFALPKLLDSRYRAEPNDALGTDSFEAAKYSKLDDEQIASIISQADALAAKEDYQSALVKVQIGLVTYPKSAELRSKVDEYTVALNAQMQAETIDEVIQTVTPEAAAVTPEAAAVTPEAAAAVTPEAVAAMSPEAAAVTPEAAAVTPEAVAAMSPEAAAVTPEAAATVSPEAAAVSPEAAAVTPEAAAAEQENTQLVTVEPNSWAGAEAQEIHITEEPVITQLNTIIGGGLHTLYLYSDGTVDAVGNNEFGQCNVSYWRDIIAVAGGVFHSVGLKSDGTVVAVGKNDNGQCNVGDWNDIIAVAAGNWHTVGLKSDGTVVAAGLNTDGQCNVGNWKDIVAIDVGYWHTVGLKSDGTVVAVGNNTRRQCNVGNWKDIIAISVKYEHTVGLKPDGTVVAVGKNGEGQCNVGNWKDIVAVAAGAYHTLGLKSDGSVVAVGSNTQGQCDIGGWTDIVAVAAGVHHSVGLKPDGSVVAVGGNEYEQCNVSIW